MNDKKDSDETSSMEELVAQLSHNINNPLMICFGNLRRLHKAYGPLTEILELQGALERITACVNKIQVTVKAKDFTPKPYSNDDSD